MGKQSVTVVLGAPAYRAPEQDEGRLDWMDKWADVYDLWAVLYHMQTGEPPIGETDTPEILKYVVQEPLVPPLPIHPLMASFPGS